MAMKEIAISNIFTSQFFRAAGVFVLDLIGAVIVPAMLEETVWRIIPVHSPQAVITKEWCLDLTVAAFMGFMMYRTWRSATSKWAWALPALWFAFRAVPYSARVHASVLSENQSFFHQFFGGSCASQEMDCRNFFSFSVPLIRSISYSLAALFASRFFKPPANMLSESK
jgi:hypothetical protein